MAGWIGGLAIALMLVLLFYSPRVDWVYDNPDHGGFTAECASIFSAGLTGDVKGYDEGREAEGVVSFDGGERMDRSEAVAACSNRRTLNAVGMALLAMPGSLLFLVGFTRGEGKE